MLGENWDSCNLLVPLKDLVNTFWVLVTSGAISWPQAICCHVSGWKVAWITEPGELDAFTEGPVRINTPELWPRWPLSSRSDSSTWLFLPQEEHGINTAQRIRRS